MANTFKLTTNAGLTTSLVDQYTVPGSTTSIVLGMSVANTSASSITIDVKVVSTTSDNGRTGNNEGSFLVKGAPVPSGSSLEIMAGNKVILETTDQITIDCSVADKLSGTLSIMEIS